MDRQEMQRRLEKVAAYRASGQKVQEWAAANGIAARELAGWLSYAKRWQARLDGTEAKARKKKTSGFVAATVSTLPASMPSTVRVECNAGATRVELHWPLSHTAELAGWLREVAR